MVGGPFAGCGSPRVNEHLKLNDREGDDFSTTPVFTHPDPTLPGSDNIGFGAYDKGAGDLLNVFCFN